MLGDTINNLSTVLGIDSAIIPNVITFIVVVIILAITLKGQLSLLTLGSIYAVAMTILTLLGIDSVFNLITIIENGIESIF